MPERLQVEFLCGLELISEQAVCDVWVLSADQHIQLERSVRDQSPQDQKGAKEAAPTWLGQGAMKVELGHMFLEQVEHEDFIER